MFLNGLKAKSISRRIEKENRSRVYSQPSLPLQKIAILQEYRNQFKEKNRKRLAALLKIDVRDIVVLTFKETIDKTQPADVNVFTTKDIGWRGVFKSDNLKTFVDADYDLLIGFHTNQNVSLNAVTALTNAKCKVGVRANETALYDLLIEVSVENEDIFITELEKYLRILKIIN